MPKYFVVKTSSLDLLKGMAFETLPEARALRDQLGRDVMLGEGESIAIVQLVPGETRAFEIERKVTPVVVPDENVGPKRGR